DVLESSMRVDHAAAQQARHAQSVAVLCGEWPGQQWPQPLALLDVVRAASSRIVAYRRVTVSGEPDVAATASVVEPLIHMIAEMVENLEPTVTPLPLPAAEPEAGPAVTEPVGVRAAGGVGVGPLPEQDDSLPQRQSRRGASEPAARGDLSSAEPAPSSQTPEQ